MRVLRKAGDPGELILWAVGASVFAHCFTFLSVSYYDQSYVPLCIAIGSIPGLCAVAKLKTKVEARDQASLDTDGKPITA